MRLAREGAHSPYRGGVGGGRRESGSAGFRRNGASREMRRALSRAREHPAYVGAVRLRIRADTRSAPTAAAPAPQDTTTVLEGDSEPCFTSVVESWPVGPPDTCGRCATTRPTTATQVGPYNSESAPMRQVSSCNGRFAPRGTRPMTGRSAWWRSTGGLGPTQCRPRRGRAGHSQTTDVTPGRAR